MHTPNRSGARSLSAQLATRHTLAFWAALLCLFAALAAPARTEAPADSRGLGPIRAYISSGWDTLTRSMNDCATVVDTKLAATSVMYLPANFPEPASIKALQKNCKFEIKHLPAVIHHPGEVDANILNPPGLLYLENRYVVPGGRFNEMYGWDSYFIIRGLVRDGRIDLARGMVENFFFEIEHYGNVLNANRSYYLSRSQPPFLTSMILSVYDAQKAQRQEDKKWLARRGSGSPSAAASAVRSCTSCAATARPRRSWCHRRSCRTASALARLDAPGQVLLQGQGEAAGGFGEPLAHLGRHVEPGGERLGEGDDPGGAQRRHPDLRGGGETGGVGGIRRRRTAAADRPGRRRAAPARRAGWRGGRGPFGLINTDFADVKMILTNAGSALMGVGYASGDGRAVTAARAAISSPLLEASIEGARGILLNVSGPSDLGLFELNEAAEIIGQAAHPDANIIFGAVIDDALGDEVRLTVIAAGFDRYEGEAARRRASRRTRSSSTTRTRSPARKRSTSATTTSTFPNSCGEPPGPGGPAMLETRVGPARGLVHRPGPRQRRRPRRRRSRSRGRATGPRSRPRAGPAGRRRGGCGCARCTAPTCTSRPGRRRSATPPEADAAVTADARARARGRHRRLRAARRRVRRRGRRRARRPPRPRRTE